MLLEYGQAEAAGVQGAAMQMGVEIDRELADRWYGAGDEATNGVAGKSSFGDAISRLDEFIRSEFTADELRSAL